MSYWAGAAKQVNRDQRKQHVPVLAPAEQVSSERIPEFGAIALLPLEHALSQAGLGYIRTELEEIKDITLQEGKEQVNEETRGIIWLDPSPKNLSLLEELLEKHTKIGFVQLPMAGINAYGPLVEKYSDKLWTSAKGAYAQPVAEHALTLALGLLRYLPMRIRATSWGSSQGLSLFNTNIVILGAGGITLSLLALLEPFRPNVTILRRKAEPLKDESIPPRLHGQVHVSTLAELDKHLANVDVIFAACALTPDTKYCLAKAQFTKMQKHSIIVNVARGEVINIKDLTEALKQGQIGGAGLDVTDPEPLPDNHPLWSLTSQHESVDVEEDKGGKRANLIITPHTADTLNQIVPLYAQRAHRNVEALQSGSGQFEGLVDAKAGY